FLQGLDESVALRALAALEQASRLRNARPAGDLERIGKHLYSSTKVHAAALRLVGSWKLTSYTKELSAVAGNKNQPTALREAVFFALREIGGPEAIAGLRGFTDKAHDETTRRHAAVVLGAIDLNDSVRRIVDVIRGAAQEQEALELWRSLLAVKGAAPGIARAVPKNGLPEAAAKAGLRAAREAGGGEPDLIIALARSAGLSEETQNLTDLELGQLAARVKNGDPARGEAVYRRKELGCTVCHAIA